METLPGYLFDPSVAGVVSLALAVLLPILVGLLSKPSVSAAQRGVLLLVLAGAKSIGEAFLAGGLNWGVVSSIAVNVVIGVAIYSGIYKPETKNGKSVANWAASNGRV